MGGSRTAALLVVGALLATTTVACGSHNIAVNGASGTTATSTATQPSSAEDPHQVAAEATTQRLVKMVGTPLPSVQPAQSFPVPGFTGHGPATISHAAGASSYWVSSQSPSDVRSYLQSHPPNGLAGGHNMSTQTVAQAVVYQLTFGPPGASEAAGGASPQVTISWTATKSGAAVLVNAFVVWAPTRSAASGRLPTTIDSLHVDINRGDSLPSVHRDIKGQGVQQLAALINSLPLAVAATTSCGAEIGPGSDQLEFVAAGKHFDVTVLGIIDVPGCEVISLGFGSSSESNLEGGYQVHRSLLKLLDLPPSYAK